MVRDTAAAHLNLYLHLHLQHNTQGSGWPPWHWVCVTGFHLTPQRCIIVHLEWTHCRGLLDEEAVWRWAPQCGAVAHLAKGSGIAAVVVCLFGGT